MELNSNTKDIDVIVVGAGPSGVSCALSASSLGCRVLVIERASDFGLKNMFGGAVYLESVKELLPDSYQNLPCERIIKHHNYVILNDNNSISFSYSNPSKNDSATITRHAFDSFLVSEAKKHGVYFAPNTLVVDIIKENGRAAGVVTQNEKIYSKAVVIAEGFNSILAQKAGLKKMPSPKSFILGVKEVIRLSSSLIEQRFNLGENEGALYEFFGALSGNSADVPFAAGFLYTFKNFVTVGVGVLGESLKNGKIPPYEYLERLKRHNFIASLIKDGEVIEYSAHSIPEGGYRELPKLYDDGILLVGDCANFVDSIHFEGTNLGIKSGILAGKICALAKSKNDFTKRVLKNYKKELFKSFIISDLKTYKSVFHTLFKRRKSVFSYYPKKADEFFNMFTSSGKGTKKSGYQKFILSFFKERSLFEMLADVISFVKCALEAII